MKKSLVGVIGIGILLTQVVDFSFLKRCRDSLFLKPSSRFDRTVLKPSQIKAKRRYFCKKSSKDIGSIDIKNEQSVLDKNEKSLYRDIERERTPRFSRKIRSLKELITDNSEAADIQHEDEKVSRFSRRKKHQPEEFMPIFVHTEENDNGDYAERPIVQKAAPRPVQKTVLDRQLPIATSSSEPISISIEQPVPVPVSVTPQPIVKQYRDNKRERIPRFSRKMRSLKELITEKSEVADIQQEHEKVSKFSSKKHQPEEFMPTFVQQDYLEESDSEDYAEELPEPSTLTRPIVEKATPRSVQKTVLDRQFPLATASSAEPISISIEQPVPAPLPVTPQPIVQQFMIYPQQQQPMQPVYQQPQYQNNQPQMALAMQMQSQAMAIQSQASALMMQAQQPTIYPTYQMPSMPLMMPSYQQPNLMPLPALPYNQPLPDSRTMTRHEKMQKLMSYLQQIAQTGSNDIHRLLSLIDIELNIIENLLANTTAQMVERLVFERNQILRQSGPLITAAYDLALEIASAGSDESSDSRLYQYFVRKGKREEQQPLATPGRRKFLMGMIAVLQQEYAMIENMQRIACQSR